MEEQKLYIDIIKDHKDKGLITEFQLEEEQYYCILSGRKTFELVLDDSRNSYTENMIIRFTVLGHSGKDNEVDSFYVQVKKVNHYKSFDALYKVATSDDSEDITMYKCGFEKNISREAFLSKMDDLYPHMEQEQLGVLAIQLELIGAPFVDRKVIMAVDRAEEKRHTTKSLFFVYWTNKAANIFKAFCLTEYAHRGVNRKFSDVPFVAHSYEVASITKRFLYGFDSTEDEEKNNVIAAAILHDVVEDTDYDLEDIEAIFGKEIRDLVEVETEIDKAPEKTWRIRKEEYLSKLSKSSYYSHVIALADKLSTMRDIEMDYKEHGNTMWKELNIVNRNDQKWYYSCIVKELGRKIQINRSDVPQIKNTQEYKELRKLVKEVFA